MEWNGFGFWDHFIVYRIFFPCASIKKKLIYNEKSISPDILMEMINSSITGDMFQQHIWLSISFYLNSQSV